VVPILEIAEEENKGCSKFPSAHGRFLKASSSSASSGITENQRNESTVSEKLNDELHVAQDEENGSRLLLFHQSINNGEIDDVGHLNPEAEVLQFSKNTTIDSNSIEDVSSAPICTKTDDEVLALVCAGSRDRPALQDMGVCRFEFLIPFSILW
jgi:hypothetical protein